MSKFCGTEVRAEVKEAVIGQTPPPEPL